MALAAGLLAMVGCHSYTPVESPAPGAVARVTVPGRSAIEGLNMAVETASVEGVVLSAGDTIVLALRRRQQWGNAGTMVVDTVRLTRERLSSIEVKEFSTRKSVLLGAAIAGAVTTLALILDVGNAEGVPAAEDELFPPGGTVITFPVGSIIAKLLGGS
ncbi:MAG: hypothetical protein IH968_17290 [Gemmatimonadetes bacterium]|nr:hypothetical protein [Gemmatimonadota bacterium]